ncbi:hypothetical protein DL767_001390 [Monosporascus sp. MG133]|nr:hypothetical protein DL767_001390 [Monosporascus sp. MG133]
MSRNTPTRSRLPQQRDMRIGPEPSNLPRTGSTRHKAGSNASALPQVQRRPAPEATNTALEQHPQAVTYVYTQLFCGLCGRYMTDIGGLASARLAADILSGKRLGPGVDMLWRLPECFMPQGEGPRSGIEIERGPHGLRGAAHSMAPLVVKADPRLPRLFLQSWLCFH